MTSGYYCAIFPFCGGGKKKKRRQKTKAFYDWATTGIPINSMKNEYGRFTTMNISKYEHFTR